MELQNRRTKRPKTSILMPERISKKVLRFDIPLIKRRQSRRQSVIKDRPISAASRSSKKGLNFHSARNSIQRIQIENELFKDIRSSQLPQVYYSKKLTLSDNSFIFDQDALKLQNLISGGYCCDQQFMSLSKFNKTKDNFILLQQIYDKAKKQSKTKKVQKQSIKSRNIFSVIFLNQNLKKMCKKQTNTIFKELKIVR